MAYELREMSVGEVLDQSFRVLKEHFVVIVGAVAIVQLPLNWVTGSMGSQFEDPAAAPSGASLAAFFGVILVGLIAMPLTQLAATRATAAAYLGEPFSIGSVFRDGAKAYMPYLGTALLVGLAMIPLMMLLVIPALYFAVCWSLIGAIAMVERSFGTRAMKRSRALVRGHFWHTVGVLFGLWVVMWVASAGPSWVLGSVPFAGPLLTGILSSIASAFSVVGIVVLYFDLRCRQEDFDLVRLAAQVSGGDAGGAVAGSPQVGAPTPGAENS